jgi:hypothetical protein
MVEERRRSSTVFRSKKGSPAPKTPIHSILDERFHKKTAPFVFLISLATPLCAVAVLEHCDRRTLYDVSTLDCDGVGLRMKDCTRGKVSDCVIRDDRPDKKATLSLVVEGGKDNFGQRQCLGQRRAGRPGCGVDRGKSTVIAKDRRKEANSERESAREARLTRRGALDGRPSRAKLHENLSKIFAASELRIIVNMRRRQ